MLSWFGKHAPIRTKFRVIAAAQAGLGAIVIAITAAAATGMVAIGPLVEIASVGAAIAAIVATTLAAGRMVCAPYVETVLRMEALAAGDLDAPIAHTNNRDCVGRMTTAMAIFRTNMERANTAETQRRMAAALGEGLGELAGGNLTFRITAPFPTEFETLRADFNRAMEAIRAAVVAVDQAATQINHGSSGILQASDDLSQRTEQQAASLEQTAAAMEQITATVRQTAAGATRASDVVATAQTEAEQSGAVVARAVEAMGGIERASHEISEIISVIDGIAFQTNLLALNAGVEAARAGDAGKGFAVVASEVRALAQRSAEAAKDVKTRIHASSDQVGVGVDLVSETGTALRRLIGRFSEISGLVGEIAVAADQQATGLQQVNTAVGEMDGVTQQNAAMVEQATAAARELSGQAEMLARQVAHFHIGDADPADVSQHGVRGVSHSVSNPVHHLQQRAVDAGRRLGIRPAGSTALALADDDWSAF